MLVRLCLTVISTENNIYTGEFKVAYAYKYVQIFDGLFDGLFDRQKTMDFKRYLLLAMDRANNRSFLISSQLNRRKVPTFFPRVGIQKSKSPHFPHHKGRNLLQSPHKVPVFPHISPGSPPLGEVDDKCITLPYSSKLSDTSQVFTQSFDVKPLCGNLPGVALNQPRHQGPLSIWRIAVITVIRVNFALC